MKKTGISNWRRLRHEKIRDRNEVCAEVNRERRRRKTKRREKFLRVFRGLVIGTGIFFIAAVWAVFVMREAGKQQLVENSVGSMDEMKMNECRPVRDLEKSADETGEEPAVEEEEEKEGRVRYKGKTFDFNEDILTFLIMGIDQRSETVQEQTEGFGGGSADAVFLLVLNPHTEKMQIIAVDRNTMTDVDIYDYYGNYEKTVQTQIAVQHGFGDGTVKSAAYMEKAVSNLFYGLPIHGYCAVNMSAIPQINDAVGGVDVTVLEDITHKDKALVKGNNVHLTGKSALTYVRYRDTNAFGSASGRLERQKQYLQAYIKQAKARFREDPALPVTLFCTLQNYMTTDLNIEKVSYLVSMAAGFDFDGTDIYKVPGKTVMGDVYEEFYVDEDAMYELILHVFYEETAG